VGIRNTAAVFSIQVLVGCDLLNGVQHPDEGQGAVKALGFGTAANLESGDGMSFSPQVAVEPDGGGTAMAVWVKLEDPDPFDSNPQQVYRLYASYYNGTSWVAQGVLDTQSANYFSAWSPKVSMDDAGNAIAVWEQNDGTAERVYARTFSGGNWGGFVTVNNPSGLETFNASAPAIAMEPAGGAAMAVWTQYTLRDWREVFSADPTDCPGTCDAIHSMVMVNGRILLGVGDATGRGDIYAFNPVSETGLFSPANSPIYDSTVYEETNALVVYNGFVYAGFGNSAGDGEVRRCDVDTACDNNAFWALVHDGNDAVRSMTVYNNLLYIGLGNSDPSGMGDVKRCDFAATSCDATGDFVLVLDHAANTYGAVPAMTEHNGALYIGLSGVVDGDGDVKRCVVCDGTDWVTVLNNTGTYNAVRSMTVHAGRLYVGLGDNAGGDGDVMRCTVCDGTDWVTVFTDGGSTTYEVVLSMASYQGYLYIGMGAGTGDGDIWRCSVCDGSDWAMNRNDAATYEGVFSLYVYPGSGALYAGFGSSAATDGDLFIYEEGWQTLARQCVDGVDAGTACGDTASEWASSDTGVCPTGSGGNDGICFISGGTSLNPSDSPVVAMDGSGRAIAAFIRQVAATCVAAETDTNPATSPANITCQDSALWVNRFSGGSWGAATNIDPNAPIDNNTAAATDTANICFINGDAANATGNLTGLATACQSAAQLRIAMDRAGSAMVVIKIYWSEAEAQDNNASTCTAGGGGGNQCDNTNATHTAAGAPPANAQDEWSGNAVAARRFDQATAAWGAPVFLYAHSNQPNNVADAGGTAFFYNCPTQGRVDVDGFRTLIECDLDAPQIAMGDTDNNPATNTDMALAVWERFDGTNHDVYADCFTLSSATTCGGVAATGWRSSFPVPEPGTATNDNYTTAYAVLNDTAVSREAFSPQVALDSTGNGMAIWTQKDATGRWRVYGMRFEAGTGFLTATRGTIDNYPGGDFYYSNPVLAMEWVNAGNAGVCPGGVSCGSAWTLFLESELNAGALLPSSLNIRVRANRWTPP
jgi:hypothetical protein